MSFFSCKKKSTPPPYVPTNDSITYDGFTYHTVTVGNITFTVENARNKHFLNGEDIRYAGSNNDWSTSKLNNRRDSGAYCSYNNATSTDTINRYGYLYNWYAIADPRGFAPPGYHVATYKDFERLIVTVLDISIEGQELKSALHWPTDPLANMPNRNKYGFAALPAGNRTPSGIFNDMGTDACFWTSTVFFKDQAYFKNLYHKSSGFSTDYDLKSYGFSVRFFRD